MTLDQLIAEQHRLGQLVLMWNGIAIGCAILWAVSTIIVAILDWMKP